MNWSRKVTAFLRSLFTTAVRSRTPTHQEDVFRRRTCLNTQVVSDINTCGPHDEAEQQGRANEGPAPHVYVLYGGHPEEDKDQGLTHTTPHLQEILDAGVAAL